MRTFSVASKGRNRRGRVSRLRIGYLNYLNNFCGLWGVRAVPSFPVHGPGVIRVENSGSK